MWNTVSHLLSCLSHTVVWTPGETVGLWIDLAQSQTLWGWQPVCGSLPLGFCKFSALLSLFPPLHNASEWSVLVAWITRTLGHEAVQCGGWHGVDAREMWNPLFSHLFWSWGLSSHPPPGPPPSLLMRGAGPKGGSSHQPLGPSVVSCSVLDLHTTQGGCGDTPPTPL